MLEYFDFTLNTGSPFLIMTANKGLFFNDFLEFF